MLYAVDEKVLVGDNQHQAYVARPVRVGDDTVLVRWESTGAREEVAVGDVKKIDLDAKRPRRKRRDASAAQTEASAPARREPPRKRRKKKEADAGAQDPPLAPKVIDEVSQDVREGIELHVKELQSGDVYGQDAAVYALKMLAEEDDANRTAIAQRLVALVANGAAGGQERAARALETLAYNHAANQAAIIAAGGVEAFVGSRHAAAGTLEHLAYNDTNCNAIVQRLLGLISGGSADDQEQAARALGRITCWDTTCTVIVEAGGIEVLVSLATNGAAGGQEAAARWLCHLADEANHAAIAAAGGIEALLALLANGSERGKELARRALEKLGLLAEFISRLQSENASLKRQLAGDDVVDLRDGDASPPAKKRNALRDAHDEQQSSTLNRVKEEKVAAERACDRTDAVAAAASAAAATATAEAADAAEELEDVHDDLVNPLTLTVNALQTKIDELHALACQVDPVAADAIKNRPN